MEIKYSHRWTFVWRTIGLAALAGVLFWGSQNKAGLQAQNPQSWSAVAHDARTLGNLLIGDYPETLNDPARVEIRRALDAFSQASNTVWRLGSTRTSLTPQQLKTGLAKAEALYETGSRGMAAGLDRMPGLIRLSGTSPVPVSRDISIPYGSVALVLRRQESAEAIPAFLHKKVDLGAGETIRVDLAGTTNGFCLLELVNPPASSGRYRLELTSGSKALASLDLTVKIPPKFPLRIDIRDGAGHATEATAGLYTPEKRILVPSTALDFSKAGFSYLAASYRDHTNAQYWPGGSEYQRCFFVRGGFTIDLPAGTYRLISSKGPEYLPVDREIALPSGKATRVRIDLRRWIHMATRGWVSGDCHIHFARLGQKANQQLELWAKAEDLPMDNILRMGDARETYFEQYAFGKRGRFLYDGGALIPGQEDPRTGVLGHTINLNIQEPIHRPQRYYLYSEVFDESHRHGGLSGYAHVNTDDFLVHRDMTLNIPRHKVDFAEICEFGGVGTELYYEFLNLGFRLTAVGGSDAPWGGTIGESRVYAYVGKKFDPDRWFAAVKAGHTFVTTGPMLEFTVDDQLPGTELRPAKGQTLKVHARAVVGSTTVPLGPLEIVANGDVIRSVKPSGNSASLDFELPADRSMWIAARTKGSHTTPVYITVEGKRHWKLSAVPTLLGKRLKTLDEIDRLIDAGGASIGQGHRAEWESREAFRNGMTQLRRMVGEARADYLELSNEANAQRNSSAFLPGPAPARRTIR